MNYFYRYLPLSEEVKQSGFYVLAGGYTLIPPHTKYPPMPHPEDHDFQWNHGRTLLEYQIIYVAKGEGVFESRLAGRRRISAGTLFTLFPGEWHRYSPVPSSGWDEYWVAFGGENAARFVAEYSLSPKEPIIHAGIHASMKEEFLRLADEIRFDQIGSQKIVAGRTSVVLAMASAYSQRDGTANNEIQGMIEEAKRLLAQRINEDVKMEELASSLNVGYSLFRKAFKQYTGFAPAQYHLDLRISHAIELLRMTTLPLSVVGERIGMSAPGYFSHMFKKKTGFSPNEFRNASQHKPTS